MSETIVSRRELERLAALRHESGIVSVYIGVSPRLIYDRDHPVAEFKGALKRFNRRAKSERWLAAAEREKDRILRCLKGRKPKGRGLAIFACEPGNLWEVVPLSVSVPSMLSVDATTQTALLAQVVEEYPRFVVVVVQRDRARIYTAEQGTSAAMSPIESDVPGRHDQGGWSQARFQRHIDSLVTGHLKKVSEELGRLYYEQPYNRLAIGGSDESIHELRKMLPEPVARRVIGTFTVDAKHDSEEEILSKARHLRDEDERRFEKDLVSRVLDETRSGGQGAIGLEQTLAVVREGRAHALVVAEGEPHEGVGCLQCDYFGTRSVDACPACGAQTERISDVIERTVERAVLTGATVNTVFGEAKEALLAEGGVGAILRY